MKTLSLPCLLIALLSGPAVAQCGLQLLATTDVGGPAAAVYASAMLPNGDLVIGGLFAAVDGTAVNNIALRSGGTWLPLGSGLDGAVNALAVMPNGDLVAGGSFAQAGAVAAARIARWDGASWAPLGSGLSGSQIAQFLGVRALLVRPNGDLIAGGHFLNAGGTAVTNIAAWNGSTWSALAGGIPGGVSPSSPPPLVEGLANLQNGDLVATGGALSVQRWNGTAWSAINAGMSPTSWTLGPKHLFVSSNGTLFACGREQPSLFAPTTPFVKQWNGALWTNYGGSLPSTGVALALTELPTGEIVVGGQSMGGAPAGTGDVMLRSGGAGAGAGWIAFAAQRALALAMQADGTLRIVAGFNDPGVTTGAFAELVSDCPASVVTVGTACAGSLGLHTLTASTLPWLGTTLRSTTSAVPASAVALAVWSLSPSTLPLSAVTPIAGAGCDGLLVPDLTELLLPNGNEATAQLALPLSPTFAGLPIHHYVAVVEFGPGGIGVALTSTARLLLTLGLF